ncbi:ER-golgi trafficking TRAPP I complex 85 kDa subunit-domain-containing protein [Zopfochytrium polystomum]|nr:ER-golgi trafficking TRAPP I complex 85 kDa subunit-domain-containing protein [Zopfochytrium polystomum]
MDFITRCLSPLVAVVASQDAEEIAKSKRLPSFVDFLRPFGMRIDGKVHVRDAQGQSSSIEGFALRFASLSQLEQFEPAVVKKVLVDSISSNYSNPAAVENSSDASEVIRAFSKGSFSSLTPWFMEYRNYICKYTGAAEHETFNHPVAYLFVVSTSNPDPLSAFTALVPPNSPLPPVFERGFIDPDIPLKHYLLVHDRERAPHIDAETLHIQMKKTFGLSCHLINVNSSGEQPGDSPDIWRDHISEIAPLYAASAAELVTASSPRPSTASLTLSPMEGELPSVTQLSTPDRTLDHAARLSESFAGIMTDLEIKGVEAFVKEFLVQSILPNMERKVQHWNEQVASSRRGITGRLFTASRRYFGTQMKPAGSAVETTNGAVFPHNSPEFIMRRLADYSFMLRDYKFAYGTYDTVKKDFQGNDRALKHFAGVQEMLAICVLFSDGSLRGNVEALLDSAISNYQNTNLSLFAARAMMFVFEMLKHREEFSDAPNYLLRLIGDDSNLRSALLLEQSAICFAKHSVPMKRKFAFYMVLAAHRFDKSNQKEHAFRCYRAALKMYEGEEWTLAEDNVIFSLGRLSYHLGDTVESFNYFRRLLRASKQSATQQDSFLREFCHTYKTLSSQLSLEQLESLPPAPIPLLDDSSINVALLESQNTSLVTKDDELWDSMEKDLVDLGFNEKAGPGKKVARLVKTTRDQGKTVCAVGEPVFISMVLRNPLLIPLEINDVFLQADFIAKAGATDADPAVNPSAIGLIQYEYFDVSCIPSLVLQPLEWRSVQFKLFPKFQGEIMVLGLQYLLASTVPTFRPFKKQGRRLNDTQQQRSVESYAADHSLTLSVTPPMPMLDVVFHSFPEALLSGQVEKAVIEVNNKGNRGLTNLYMKLSHPSFFAVGTAEMMDNNSYCDIKETQEPTLHRSYGTQNILANTSVVRLQLPSQNGSGEVLAAGMTTLIPVWIRGDRIGKHNFRFLFGYQSEGEADGSSYRQLKCTTACQISPSLRINAFTRPSSSILKEFILGIEIENLQPSTDVVLRQVTSLSPMWSICPISERTLKEETRLGGKQTSFVYFRFQLAGAKSFAELPEATTTRALTQLIKGEEPTPFSPHPLNMVVSSIAAPTRFVDCAELPFRTLSLNSRVQWRTQSLSAQYPGLSPERLRDLFTLYYTDDVDISILWEAPSPDENAPPRAGHHYIIGINLGIQAPLQLHARLGRNSSLLSQPTGRSLYAATARERKALIESLLKPRQKDVSPVRMILRTLSEYEYDFATGNFVATFTAVLRNTSWENSVKYKLDLLAMDVKGSQRDDSMTDFSWLGSINQSGSLKPEEEVGVPIKASFFRPGTYDVNRWRLSVTVFLPELPDAAAGSPSRKKGGGGGSSPPHQEPAGTTYIQMPNWPQFITIKQCQ